jgi:hypothetical protein
VKLIGRRCALSALASAPVALSAAPAIAAESGQDPHLEWWRERERLIAKLATLEDADDEGRQPVLDAKWAIEDRIADTPAATLAGLRLQAQVGLRYLEEDMDPDDAYPQIEVRALRNIVASLEQLTGRASA